MHYDFKDSSKLNYNLNSHNRCFKNKAPFVLMAWWNASEKHYAIKSTSSAKSLADGHRRKAYIFFSYENKCNVFIKSVHKHLMIKCILTSVSSTYKRDYQI